MTTTLQLFIAASLVWLRAWATQTFSEGSDACATEAEWDESDASGLLQKQYLSSMDQLDSTQNKLFIKQVFSIGDSLQDVGLPYGLWSYTNKTLPSSELGYYNGHITNGMTFAEYFKKKTLVGIDINVTSFAAGLATVGPNINDPYHVGSIGDQIPKLQAYVNSLGSKARSEMHPSLCLLNGGGNDINTYVREGRTQLLHVMHDASHGAIGHNEGYWKFFGRLALDWMAGSNMMSWHHQHIVGHHVYTNVYEADPDLPHPGGDIRRLVSRQAMAAMYQWQWLYLPIVYGILGMRARVQDITDTMLARTSGMLRVNAYDNFWTRIVLVKVIWALWRIVLPLSMGTVSTREFWTLFFLAEFVSGYWLAFNFQVSHITTDVEWPNGSDKAATVPFTWAENQVKTSLDYGHDSTLQTFLCGALNYQIEHHLFPGVSQYHYPAIAPIVRETCKEYGLPYRYEPDFLHAVGAHWSHLKQMSAAGKEVHVD